MARIAGEDVEVGFDALAKGVLAENATTRRYRSKARRRKHDLERRAGRSNTAGDDTAAENAENVRETSKALCERILRLESQRERSLAIQSQRASMAAIKGHPGRASFLSVSTGMQLRYLEWGPSSSEVVVLLHGMGESSGAWSAIAHKLADHGYHVYAIDARGHGQTTWSSSHQYDARSMAADLRDFVLELDLYKDPFALVGTDMGAAVAAEFAFSYPKLVGILALIDYYPLCGSDSRLRYCKVQGAGSVPSLASTIALLTSPLMEDQRRTRASAERSVPLIFVNDEAGGGSGMRPRMDPNFFFAGPEAAGGHSDETLAASVGAIACPILFLCSNGDGASEKMDILSCLNKNATLALVTKSSRFALSESPFEVYSALKRLFIREKGAFVDEARAKRTPESLGLRSLPEYGTLQDALKALGPRKIPTLAAIEAELRRFKVREGEEPSSSSEDETGQTSLANNPSDYFGMVG